jgi:hypothetical protein
MVAKSTKDITKAVVCNEFFLLSRLIRQVFVQLPRKSLKGIWYPVHIGIIPPPRWSPSDILSPLTFTKKVGKAEAGIRTRVISSKVVSVRRAIKVLHIAKY